MQKKKEICVLELSEPDKIKFTRLAMHLRQIDLASMSHTQVFEIAALEKGRHVRKSRRIAILKVLGMATPEEITELDQFLRQQEMGGETEHED